MRLIGQLNTPASATQTIVRRSSYGLAAAALGLALGWLFAARSYYEFAASAIFVAFGAWWVLRHPFHGLLLTIVIHPFFDFLYLNIRFQNPGIPNISLGRLVVVLLFALTLARGATGRWKLAHLTRAELAMGLALIGLGISATRGTPVTTSWQLLLDRYVIPYIIYYTIKNLIPDRAAVHHVLWAVALIGAYNGLYGIYTQTTGNILFVSAEKLANSKLWYSENLRIMRGLLDSPHVFGLVFSIAIPVDFYLLIKSQTTGKKVAAALMLAITFVALFLTYKRTAWLATMGSLVVIQLFFPRFRRWFLVLFLVMGGLLVLYQGELSDSTVVTERVNAKTATLNGRTELWDAAIAAWQKAPVLGYGRGQYRTNNGLIESHYLNLLVEAGLVGFVPFALVLIMLLWTGLRLYFARQPGLAIERDMIGVFVGVLAAYLISLYTVVMNHMFPHMLFFLLAGAAVGAQEKMLAQRRSDEAKLEAHSP